MLYVIENELRHDEKRYHWHAGEPPLPLSAGFITFRADGDELGLILAAIGCRPVGAVVIENPEEKGFTKR